MTEPAAKKQKTEDYVLYYWPGLPGRGEYVRLAFEYAGIPYTEKNDPSKLISTITDPSKSSAPPAFAPPALQLPSGRFISQTAAILNHIAPKFGLAGEKWSESVKEGKSGTSAGEEAEEERSAINQLVQTALDLNTEAHNTHHPVATHLYYDEQKEAAAENAKAFRAQRLPKYFKHFQNVLTSNPDVKNNGGTYLIGSTTTTADLTLFHVIEGVTHAFPKRVAALKETGEYDNVFKLRDRVASEKGIKEYLASGRRLKFGDGIFRYYEELDLAE